MELYIIIIVLVLIIIPLIYYNCSTCKFSEPYEQYETFMGNCGDCNYKSIGQCLKCLDCGFISKDGYGKCVKGDAYGPLYYDPSYVGARWITGDQYWSDVVLTDDMAMPTTNVYTNRYPYYQRFVTDAAVVQNDFKPLEYRPNIDHNYPVITDGGKTLQVHASGIPEYNKKQKVY